MPTAAVVVCVHLAARVPMLLDALASLRRQSLAPDEVVVVVDGDRQLLETVQGAVGDAGVVWTGGGRGLSVARNEGVGTTKADLIAFLDDDAVADRDWLRRLYDAALEPSVIGVSGRSLPRWEGPAPWWMPPELLWTVGCSYRGMPRGPAVVRNFFGGCGVVRREVFVELGGFNPALGRQARGVAGGEEAEFCARALRARPASRFVYEPAAVIHHHVPTTRARLRYVLRRCWADGRAKSHLLVAAGLTGMGPERRFVARSLRSLVSSVAPGGRRRGELRAAEGLVLLAGVSLAALGCLVTLPTALVRARTTPEDGR